MASPLEKARKDPKSMKGRMGKFIFLGVGGLFLTLTRFAAVPHLSKRLWLYMILVLSVVLLLRTICQVRGDYRKRINSVKREARK